MRAIFFCPFNDETRQTTFPQAPEGQEPYRISFTHIEQESGGRVKALIIADESIINIMKSDPQFEWVEDMPEETMEEK